MSTFRASKKIVNDTGDGCGISRRQETRHFQAHDYVFSRHYFLNGRANPCIRRDGPGRGPPGGQVIRQLEAGGSFSIRTCNQVSLPEGSVFEFTTDGGLSERILVFEVCQLIAGFRLRKIDRFITGVARKLITNCESGLYLIVAVPIKIPLDIRGGLGLDAVDSFVDYS